MAIEWGLSGVASPLNFRVVDVSGVQPLNVVQKTDPLRLAFDFQVPSPFHGWMNASHSFRLRAYAESIGPGPELKLGETTITGVRHQTNYAGFFDVPAGTLPGEGDSDPATGQPVSGTYNIIVVLQMLNGNHDMGVSGIDDQGERLVMVRTPSGSS